MVEPGVASHVFEGPNRIGPYELIAKLAQGGMGTVYLARMGGPAGFNKLAVVKELKEELLGSARFAQLFLEEARLAARLTHANIVHTYGAGEYDGRLYIAMEYLDGQPWTAVRHRLKANHALPLHVQVKVLADSLAGLHYAHELREFNGTALNVVHCDMSPQNVFVTYDGQVKVVDFGVARAAHDGAPRKDNVFLGKVAYCAPEQARGEPIDRRADIFAVGVMLWESISGKRFALGDEPATTLQARAQGAEPRIRDAAPTAPPALAAICDRALSLHPGERFATAAEFRTELMEFMAKNGRTLENTQLGRLVSNAFEEERKRVHGLIDSQLEGRSDDSKSIADVSGVTPSVPADCTLQADLSRLASVTRLTDESNMSSAISASLVSLSNSVATPLIPPVQVNDPPQRGSKLPLSLAAVALIAIAAAGTYMMTRAEKPVPEPAALGTTATTATEHTSQPTTTDSSERQRDTAIAPAPAPAPAPATLTLRISTTPASAELFLDGKKVGNNPFAASPARDHAMHQLKAVAAGYQTEERILVFDRDIDLKLVLEREPSNTQHSKPRRIVRRKAAPTPAPAPTPTPTAAEPEPAETPKPEPSPSGKRAKPKDTSNNQGDNGLQIYDEDPYQ